MKPELFNAILERFQSLGDTYDVDGFMSPYLQKPSRTWAIEDERGESSFAFEGDDFEKGATAEYRGVLPAVRLSANGFMDQTDWTPLESVADLDEWAELYLEPKENEEDGE